MSEPRTWQEVKDRLEARRAALNEEIATYPAPIPACDAQFNHLLEQRARLNAELNRLDTAMSDASPAALGQFVQSCPFLERDAGDARS